MNKAAKIVLYIKIQAIRLNTKAERLIKRLTIGLLVNMDMEDRVSDLIAVGIDSKCAARIARKGYTLRKIKSSSENDLRENFGTREVESIRKAVKRKPIPRDIVSRLIKESDCKCCICWDITKETPVIIHHIEDYSETQDNSYENLVILCLDHHALAHSDWRISQHPLPKELIRERKREWIRAVSEFKKGLRSPPGKERALEKIDETVGFLVEISFQLSDFQILWSDHERRTSNPDLEQLRCDIGDTGRAIMKLSADPKSHAFGLSSDLQELGDLLEDMEHHRFLLDGGMSLKDFWNKGDRALGATNTLLSQILGKHQVQEEYYSMVRDEILMNINKLRDCWRRKDRYLRNRNLSMLQETLKKLACDFNRCGNLFSQFENQTVRAQLKEIAMTLRELSSQKHFMQYLGMNPIEAMESRMNEIIEISGDIQNKIT